MLFTPPVGLLSYEIGCGYVTCPIKSTSIDPQEQELPISIISAGA